MASSGIGRFGISLISLPLDIAKTIKDSLTSAELVQVTGSAKRLPASVGGLKPANPAFTVVNGAPISAPYHTIIGDRGKADSPHSTDEVYPIGVVSVWRERCGLVHSHSRGELKFRDAYSPKTPLPKYGMEGLSP